jgi:hypothetical protein
MKEGRIKIFSGDQRLEDCAQQVQLHLLKKAFQTNRKCIFGFIQGLEIVDVQISIKDYFQIKYL